MVVCRLRVLGARFAMLVGAAGVLLGLFVLPMIVIVGSLAMMMRGGFMMRSGLVVMVARGMLLLGCHLKPSLCKAWCALPSRTVTNNERDEISVSACSERC